METDPYSNPLSKNPQQIVAEYNKLVTPNDAERIFEKLTLPPYNWYERSIRRIAGLINCANIDPAIEPPDLIQRAMLGFWQRVNRKEDPGIRFRISPRPGESEEDFKTRALVAYLNAVLINTVIAFAGREQTKKNLKWGRARRPIRPVISYDRSVDKGVVDDQDTKAGDFSNLPPQDLNRLYQLTPQPFGDNQRVAVATLKTRSDYKEILEELGIADYDLVNVMDDPWLVGLINIAAVLRDLKFRDEGGKQRSFPRSYRWAVLDLLDGKTAEETAIRRGCHVGQVYIWRNRAQNWLRKNIGEQKFRELLFVLFQG